LRVPAHALASTAVRFDQVADIMRLISRFELAIRMYTMAHCLLQRV
jgi:hypothetical protein